VEFTLEQRSGIRVEHSHRLQLLRSHAAIRHEQSVTTGSTLETQAISQVIDWDVFYGLCCVSCSNDMVTGLPQVSGSEHLGSFSLIRNETYDYSAKQVQAAAMNGDDPNDVTCLNTLILFTRGMI
jgi:hypothetical protein